MDRIKKKITVLRPGAPLRETATTAELEETKGGRTAANLGCGGPNDCVARQQF